MTAWRVREKQRGDEASDRGGVSVLLKGGLCVECSWAVSPKKKA